MSLTYGDTHVELIEALDADLRAAVRAEGVDPQRDSSLVRRLAETVVADHDQRSLTGVVRPVGDHDAVVDELVSRVSGFGALQRYLDDPTVEEIWVNDPSRVFVARAGRHELTSTILNTGQVKELVERMLKASGRRIDVSQPFVDAMLPQGHRLHVVLEGISRGFSAVNIRKFVVRAARLHDLVALGSLTEQAASFLDASVRAGLNIVVAGSTQAGKTTMLNCLAASIPGRDRVVSVEEVFELRFSHPDWVALQTRQQGLEGTGEIRLRDLVKESLRMRPSRVIVGEVRAEECLDLLLALNAGLPGMASLHANSAREALVKLCTLPLLAGENISARFVVPTVASSVDLVVHLGIGPDGARRVEEIVAVPGRVENDVIETEPIFVRSGDRLVRTAGHAPACGALRPGRHRRPVPAERRPVSGRRGRARRRRRPGAHLARPVGAGHTRRRPERPLVAHPRPARPRRSGRYVGRRTVVGGGRVHAARVRLGAGRVRHRRRVRDVRADGGLPPLGDPDRAGPSPAARARRGVARGRRQPRLRRPGRPVPARGARAARPPRTRAAARAVPRVRRRLPGHRPLRRESLDRLKQRLADPVGDRVVEGLRIAREVGGGELGSLLRNLSGFLREDARTRSELESRQSWTVNGARLAVAAPWLVLLMLCFQREVIARYASPAGVVVLLGGAVLCLVAYRLMVRIGRLPTERRVLS